MKDQTRDGEGMGRRLFNVSEWVTSFETGLLMLLEVEGLTGREGRRYEIVVH